MTVEDIMAAINSADSLEDLKKALEDDIPVCLDSMVKVLDHLMATTGQKFKSMKQIESRMREGFLEDELMLIIDWKVAQWGDDAKMSAYIRPDTLFRSKNKSDGYLEEALNWQAKLMGEKRNAEERKARIGRAIVPTFN